MASHSDLEDPTQTCIYLAPREDLDDAEHDRPLSAGLELAEHDIPEGYVLRLHAYKQAWDRCLERVQSIVRQLHAPVVASVVSHIHQGHDESQTVPGLPYPELPVIGLSLPDGSSILEDILEGLNEVHEAEKPPQVNGVHKSKGKGRMVHDIDVDMEEDAASIPARQRTLAVHLSPAECPNLVSTMKAIVSGFVDRVIADEEEEEDDALQLLGPKRKATLSLANYDMNLLEAWFVSLREQSDAIPQLLVVIHDFDQFDVNVLQDVFEICSQHISKLPLIFLLALSTPSALSYLRGALPRSTLALLRIQTMSAPSGPDILEEVLVKTFFDAEFEPDVMLGSATLDYIVEHGTRHTTSIDTMLSILRLAHMKHFEQPFTIFVHDTTLGEASTRSAISKLEQPESFTFLDTLLSRLWTDVADQPTLDSIQLDEESPSIESLLGAVSSARIQARRQAQKMRIAFQTMYLVRRFMQAQGYKTTVSGPPEVNALELLSRVVRGRVNKEVKYMGMVIKKLSAKELATLLQSLHHFFQSLRSPDRRDEEAARVRIIAAIAQLPSNDSNEPPDASSAQIATGIGEWLVEYLESRLVRLDQGPLWNVWNTGMTPFPSELLNPAPRLTIINALLHPYEVLSAQRKLFGPASDPEAVQDEREDRSDLSERQYALWELPDTSILFRRYMDSGRMINVYDWYESFAVVLDVQRGQLRKLEKEKRERAEAEKKAQAKGKGRGRGKGKQKAAEPEDVEMDDHDEEAEEKWRMEVQARFMRALHELDFMGFVKHTGRKADHVVKTIYDIPD